MPTERIGTQIATLMRELLWSGPGTARRSMPRC
jgi:hypothetical protein